MTGKNNSQKTLSTPFTPLSSPSFSFRGSPVSYNVANRSIVGRRVDPLKEFGVESERLYSDPGDSDVLPRSYLLKRRKS